MYCSKLLSAALATALLSFACGDSPSSPSGKASVTVPRAVSPAAGATVPDLQQPVTLVVQNAVTTGGSPVYEFEVASDTGFATRVQLKEGIAEGANGQTSVRLDTLPAGRDYYWRSRTTSGGSVSPYGATTKLTIGPAIVIGAPVPVSPNDGASISGQVVLTVVNAPTTGPAGPLTYRFELSTNNNMTPIALSANIAAGGSGRTSWTPTQLASNTVYYWRVTPVDTTNNITGTASPVRRFSTSVIIDLSRVIVSYPGSPSGADMANWPVTGTITGVEQDGNPAGAGPMCIAFVTSVPWPTIPFFGDEDVQVFANQWYFANINGQWYGGPGEYLRAERGFCKTGQATDHIGPDGGWTSPMNTWAPKAGELVGYMMSTPARAGMRSINHRSDIVVQPWVDSSVSGPRAFSWK